MDDITEWVRRGGLGSETASHLISKAILAQFLREEADKAPCGLTEKTRTLANLVESGDLEGVLSLCHEILLDSRGAPLSSESEKWATWIGVTRSYFKEKEKTETKH